MDPFTDGLIDERLWADLDRRNVPDLSSTSAAFAPIT